VNNEIDMITLDLRGRDLIIIPSEESLHLSTAELLQVLFGSHLPSTIRANIGRDKRHHFLRTQPIHFTSVKSALRKQQTPFIISFDEHPALPFETALGIEPRPYQNEALTHWLAAGSSGIVVLPTGAGKTFVAATRHIYCLTWMHHIQYLQRDDLTRQKTRPFLLGRHCGLDCSQERL
jgi:hypothetical protein